MTVTSDAPGTTVAQLVAPPLPAAPISTALQNAVDATGPTQTVEYHCYDLLTPQEQAAAKAAGKALVDTILSNRNVILTYGNKEIEPVNSLLDTFMEAELTRQTDVPELEGQIKGTSRAMRNLAGNTASSDPAVQKKYNNWRAKFRRFIFFWRGSWDLWRDDVKSVADHINGYQAVLEQGQRDLMKIVTEYGVYYAKNEDELHALVPVIATMEYAAIDAAERADAVVVDSNNPYDRKAEEKGTLSTIATQLQGRATDFKGRLVMGWLTAPGIRASRDNTIALASKLNATEFLVLPKMKLVVWRWTREKKNADTARTIGTLRDSAAQIDMMYADASVGMTAETSAAIQTPLTRGDEITALANALVRSADAEVQALQIGQQHRAEVAQAMVGAIASIKEAGGKVTKEQIDQVLKAAQAPSPVAAIAAQQYVAAGEPVPASIANAVAATA